MNTQTTAQIIREVLVDNPFKTFTVDELWYALIYAGHDEVSMRDIRRAAAFLPSGIAVKTKRGAWKLAARDFARPDEIVELVKRDDAGMNLPLLLTDERLQSWAVALGIGKTYMVWRSVDYAAKTGRLELDHTFYGDQVRVARNR